MAAIAVDTDRWYYVVSQAIESTFGQDDRAKNDEHNTQLQASRPNFSSDTIGQTRSVGKYR